MPLLVATGAILAGTTHDNGPERRPPACEQPRATKMVRRNGPRDAIANLSRSERKHGPILSAPGIYRSFFAVGRG
jgi:hypothetical protein